MFVHRYDTYSTNFSFKHLTAQWKVEAEKCIPNVKVHVLTSIQDHKKLSWNDVLLADIVIVSVSFLQNNNYTAKVNYIVGYQNPLQKSYTARDLARSDCLAYYIADLKQQGRGVFGNERG